ncbi:hypothetical protein QR665_10755 [Acinetobacter gerneri]|uniref:hypothetical protein n=1 Tax=Acinetobacter gerneri TaxID=202952 RepID=UPI0029363A3B|nr:hypothetical protein [Acinetobacter gerneri]MDV2439947.1 hypothetical protein [Acinetobacter gerneri]
MAKKLVLIALTTAVVFDGVIRKAGEQIEVEEQMAKELLYRGRGTLVDSDEDEEVELAKMTKAQLIEFAKNEYQTDLDTSLNKDQLIEAIIHLAEA